MVTTAMDSKMAMMINSGIGNATVMTAMDNATAMVQQ